jgi:hypothetical protein
LPSARKDAHLYDLARRGAEARLGDLLHELKMLANLFPDLADRFDPDELPVSFLLKKGARPATAPPSGRRTGMSAAAREAVSDRMKRYWATRRGAPKK